jgi:putative ABC transport system permease protein
MQTVIDTLVTGLPYVPLTLAVYMILRVREDFDLTIEGSFAIGGAVCGVLLAHHNPVPAAMLGGILAGAGAGLITTSMHILLRVPIILGGLVTSLGIYSVDLHIMGTPTVALLDASTLFSGFSSLSTNAHDWATIGVLATFAFAVLLIIGAFLRTELGLALRVSGRNVPLVRSQGVNPNFLVAVNLLIANALSGLSGTLVVQSQAYSDVNMGIGILLVGLGSLLLGELITRPSGSKLIRGLLAVIVGAILFRFILTLAINSGLEPTDLKLAIAITLITAFALQRVLALLGNRARVRRAARRLSSSSTETTKAHA